ncbi:MAG: glycosyltransferase family 4 protein, partial [Hyalangium sp.]|uniref:glycosyltransferase family 4 protein n=1 Tax=Hyalangium sp. TaxID=2028555 RepID=UPI003899D97C
MLPVAGTPLKHGQACPLPGQAWPASDPFESFDTPGARALRSAPHATWRHPELPRGRDADGGALLSRPTPPVSEVAWHLLTGEYPPQPGGVSDYTRLIARELARRGLEVHVWAPGKAGETREEGVTVHRAPGLFTPAGLIRLSRGLERCRAPRRLLLQYVPHAFGLKAM